MTDFFLTYRDFLDSADLCQLLVSRFYWALENDDESRRIVRIRYVCSTDTLYCVCVLTCQMLEHLLS